MCSIIGSFDKNNIIDLAKLNARRGQHSWSISYYSLQYHSITSVERGLGELPVDRIDIPFDSYCIVHQQAPTTENKGLDTIHPAQVVNSYLWHNGILKAETIKKLQLKHQSTSTWDTFLMLLEFMQTQNVEDVDGTFSCIAYLNGLFLFRNEIAPLFIDDKYSISSTKFKNSRPLPPNVVWIFEPGDDLVRHKSFRTVNNPYFME